MDLVSTPASAATAATRQLERALGRDLAIRRVRLDALHLDPANARARPDRNLQSIQDSLARFGQAEPLVIQKSTGRIIGGNGRLVAMKKLGWSECDVVELDIDDLQATALGIASQPHRRSLRNGTGRRSRSSSREAARSRTPSTAGVRRRRTSIRLLEELEEAVAPDLEDPGAKASRPCPPVSKTGDLWILGAHRMLCGDSTKPEDVERVMAGETACCSRPDPPYRVDYTGRESPEQPASTSPTEGKDWDAYNDPETSIEDLGDLESVALAHARSASRPTSGTGTSGTRHRPRRRRVRHAACTSRSSGRRREPVHVLALPVGARAVDPPSAGGGGTSLRTTSRTS